MPPPSPLKLHSIAGTSRGSIALGIKVEQGLNGTSMEETQDARKIFGGAALSTLVNWVTQGKGEVAEGVGVALGGTLGELWDKFVEQSGGSTDVTTPPVPDGEQPSREGPDDEGAQ